MVDALATAVMPLASPPESPPRFMAGVLPYRDLPARVRRADRWSHRRTGEKEEPDNAQQR